MFDEHSMGIVTIQPEKPLCRNKYFKYRTDTGTRKMKNVDMTERKAPQLSSRKDGLQIRSISTPSGRGLKIKSRK